MQSPDAECPPQGKYQCSFQHAWGMSAQQAFSTEFPLMWEWGESISFDVAIGSTQTMPSCHAWNFAWGEHWKSGVQTVSVAILDLSTEGARIPIEVVKIEALGFQ